jgi:aldehyde dehydrogenase (NAD+)
MKIVLENLNLKPDSMGTSSGLNWYGGSSSKIKSYSPVDGEMIGEVNVTSKDDYIKTINAAKVQKEEKL